MAEITNQRPDPKKCSEHTGNEQLLVLTMVKRHLSQEIALLTADLQSLSGKPDQEYSHPALLEIKNQLSEITSSLKKYPECKFRGVQLAPYSAMWDSVTHATARLMKDENGFDIFIRHDIGLSGSYLNILNIRRLMAMCYIDSNAGIIVSLLDDLISSSSLAKKLRSRVVQSQKKFSNMLISSKIKGEVTALHIALKFILQDIRKGVTTENLVMEALYSLDVAEYIPDHDISKFYTLEYLLLVEENQEEALKSGDVDIPRAMNKRRQFKNPRTWFGIKQVELDDYLISAYLNYR